MLDGLIQFLVCLQINMKRLSINYNRSFPDHRVPVDYHFNRKLMSGPSTYFRFMKEGFNATGAKYFHVYLSIIGAVAMAVTATCVFWNTDSEVTHIKKLNFPGYKYVILTQKGGYGAYDNILQRFEKEPGGIRDLPWTE